MPSYDVLVTMAGQPLDPDEWESVLGKLLRFHRNIQDEITGIIAKIRAEMKQDLIPVAEERAVYGKKVKAGIRSMWALEYEIQDLQEDFAKQLGNIDLDNLTDDFVEEALLHSKPLQGILKAIRIRQRERMDEMKKEYGEAIKDLEPLKLPREPKPPPKPPGSEPEKKPEEAAKPAADGEKKEGEAAPAPAEGQEAPAAPAEGDAPAAEAAPTEAAPADAAPAEAAPPAEEAAPPAEAPPAEPAPAVDATVEAPAVEASA